MDSFGGRTTSCEPHKISFYLLEVAEAFHALWGYGNSQATMRFVVPGNEASSNIPSPCSGNGNRLRPKDLQHQSTGEDALSIVLQ